MLKEEKGIAQGLTQTGGRQGLSRIKDVKGKAGIIVCFRYILYILQIIYIFF